MPHRVYAYGSAVQYTCDATKCLFTNEDQAIIAQHENDAHGPAWMATDQAPQQPTTGVVSPQ
ncbi:hypothetical protein [Saccharopolyspora spinosa]|uniref:Uncharacterized protein n=1 Tax=Saccharopolyspora spinosa TaxID=60894 RepID=A0A2N3Y7X3_SACSN|nr:hypothetical protein [Saccharopolyspora spinosa]PKW18985.1 hypothetical protein A8926_7125 [Saccharopolyspora spinosa]